MAGFPTVEAQAAQSRHGGSMRSKKGPSVFCRPTGGAAEQGGGHEGVVGNDGSGGSRGQHRAKVRLGSLELGPAAIYIYNRLGSKKITI